jgi:hypothetical protein
VRRREGGAVMKVRVAWDERYPDFMIATDTFYPEIEITEEEFVFIKKADADYEKAQAILARAKVR